MGGKGSENVYYLEKCKHFGTLEKGKINRLIDERTEIKCKW